MYDLDKSQLGRLKKDYLVNIILNLRKENKDLLNEISDSLYKMIDYADDGTLSRYDKNYETFFKDLDKANEILEKINTRLGEM